MQWRNVQLIWLRELTDQLRDRRTLFMVVVLPMLLYPSLGIGMMQLTLLFTEQPRTIVIVGSESLPEPKLVDGDYFEKSWFERESDRLALNVVRVDRHSTGPGDSNPVSRPESGEEGKSTLQELVAEMLPEIDRMQAIEGREDPEAVAEWNTRRAKLNQCLAHADFQVLMVVPQDLKLRVAELGAALKDRTANQLNEIPKPLLIHNSADDKSVIAMRRTRDILRSWETRLVEQQLREGGLPTTLSAPVRARALDVAAESQVAANVWGKLFPSLLVLMAVTGAFYPAIDLGAGEKERGTMETLLICPAARSEIVMGKFLTVIVISMSTALLNLASLGFTSKYMVSLAASGVPGMRVETLATPPLASLLWVVALLIPLAALFSALCLALATFARSSKEGQYYLTPLIMVTAGITIFCSSPGIEIQPFYSMMPVMGPALLLKGLLNASGGIGELSVYIPMVLISSAGYCVLALWWAIDQFSQEEVLFRESERFDLRLWMKHLLRTKEPLPSFSEAALCFMMIMLLQFGAMKFMQEPLRTVAPEDRGTLMMQLLIVQQLVIIATPALIMGILLTTSLRQTFGLRWPGFRFLGGGLLLAIVLHPLTLSLQGWLQRMKFFPGLPPGVQEIVREIISPNQPTWLVFLAFAIAPGICEELAFRGFLLHGFGRNGRWRLAVVLSALTFGLVHMIPQQVLNAGLLGLILGLLAVRSRSLFPGIAFHITYNGLELSRNRFGMNFPQGRLSSLFWTVSPQEGVTYQWPLLLLCLAILATTVWWLTWKQALAIPTGSTHTDTNKQSPPLSETGPS